MTAFKLPLRAKHDTEGLTDPPGPDPPGPDPPGLDPPGLDPPGPNRSSTH